MFLDGHRGLKIAMLQESGHLLGQCLALILALDASARLRYECWEASKGVAEELLGSMPGVEKDDLAVLLYSGPGTKRNYDKCLSGVATDLDTQRSV